MLRRALPMTFLLGLLLIFVSGSALAQYQLTTLDSNQVKQSTNTADPQIVNAWGLARSPGSPWWVNDNGSGWATIYNGAGVKQGLEVEIPPAPNSGPIGLPTGMVWNPSQTNEFQVQGWPSPTSHRKISCLPRTAPTTKLTFTTAHSAGRARSRLIQPSRQGFRYSESGTLAVRFSLPSPARLEVQAASLTFTARREYCSSPPLFTARR